jgi:hypothetical protein
MPEFPSGIGRQAGRKASGGDGMSALFWVRIMSDVRLCHLLGLAAAEVRRRLYADEFFYGLEFDLTGPIPVYEAGTALAARKIQESDVAQLLPLRDPRMDVGELKTRLERLLLLRAGIPTCYVCVPPDGQPCGMCWLVTSHFNPELQRHFRGGIQPLRGKEVLLENIYTRADCRGGHIMAWLTLKLFDIAARQGAVRAIAFIKAQNKASLKGIQRIGWKLCVIKKVTWRFFTRRITYSYDLSQYAIPGDGSTSE